MFVRRGQLGFDHDGVLGPRLQWSNQVLWVFRLLAVRGARRRIDIGNGPAVRAARVLSVKLCDVPVWTGTERRAQMLISADRATSLDSNNMSDAKG